MKKLFSLILALTAVFSLVSFDMNKASAADIDLMYNNTSSAKVALSINSSAKATISLNCVGISGTTKKIVAETKLERKWGLLWLDVDGGEWTDTVNKSTMSLSHTIQLSKTGTYRVTTTFTVSGTGGADDTIKCQAKYEYT